MKKILLLCCVFLILAGVIVYQQNRIGKFKNENKRLNTSVESLLEGVKRYTVRDSLHAAGVGALELKIEEFRKRRRLDAKLIEELDVKLKRVESTSLHTVQSGYRIEAPVKDTVFLYRERPESLRRFSYRSPHIRLDGQLQNDSVKITLTSYDTLVQVVHRIPKQFLFIRYGTKKLRQEIVSKNPHSVITHTEFIQIGK